MKKISSILLMLILIFSLVGCKMNSDTNDKNNGKFVDISNKESNDETAKYKVTVEDNFDIILENLNTSYEAGEVVTVKLRFHSGARVGLLVDGEEVLPKEFTVWNYELYEFIMPEKDVLVQTTFNDNIDKPKIFDQYIYFDKVLASVNYTINFNYQETEETLKLHKDFIEKSGLKDLDYNSIFYFPKSASIFLHFNPSKDTIIVQDFMNSLKEEPSVVSVEKHFEYFYDNVYMHNPLYYGLQEESHKIPYEFASPSFLPSGIYKSVQDILDGIDYYYEQNKNTPGPINKNEKLVNHITTHVYNEEYFNDYILVITDTITTGSGSNKQQLNSVFYKDNKLYVFVKMYFTNMGTCDMQYTRFILKIDKKYIDDVDNLSLEFLYNHPKYDNHGLW
ncbi:MAG TPA: hypothetical protein GXZ48_06395 [Acholeplasmataceae bacterium]|nr:hypothetical protein [Acholeplasmataceae bacterium]